MSENEPAILIDASPTKDFFISILVRDIKLSDAIADLVDNCVDGARRLRPGKNYQGLRIAITFDSQRFTIADNCGGIPFEVAKNYAFRFGRPPGMPATTGSVGQFGVGMKRALFKMGEHFCIESTEPKAEFKVDVDVRKWRSSFTEDGQEKWEFEFKDLDLDTINPIDKCGTRVTVDALYPGIAEEFGSKIFETRVLDAIQSAHEQSIHDGLEIQINAHQIKHRLSTLLSSDSIKPLKTVREFEVPGVPAQASQPSPETGDASGTAQEASPETQKAPETPKIKVTATIYAGISDAVLEQAGWYVICNGRQVLRADKTQTVGWDDAVNDIKIPKAHYQFARFRGFVFFESDNASALPWNTMKNAVDPESPIYQATRLDMVSAMRQVIDFLNKLDAEADTEGTTLSGAIQTSKAQPLSAINTSSTFVYPEPNTVRAAPTSGRIAFVRPIEEIEFAKKHFGVSAAKAAGERSFEYFLEREMF